MKSSIEIKLFPWNQGGTQPTHKVVFTLWYIAHQYHRRTVCWPFHIFPSNMSFFTTLEIYYLCPLLPSQYI